MKLIIFAMINIDFSSFSLVKVCNPITACISIGKFHQDTSEVAVDNVLWINCSQKFS